MIDKFSKEYEFLNNFYPTTIEYDNKKFNSVAHAYYYYTINDNDIKQSCLSDMSSLSLESLIRSHEIKHDLKLLKNLLLIKFKDNKLMSRLKHTEKEYLNYCNKYDFYLGVCRKTSIGENLLGRILMEIRDC